MEALIAEQFAEEINNSFSGTDYVDAWADVHGKNEAELVVEVDYRDEDPQRLYFQNDDQALSVFQLIYAAKEQGLQDAMGV